MEAARGSSARAGREGAGAVGKFRTSRPAATTSSVATARPSPCGAHAEWRKACSGKYSRLFGHASERCRSTRRTAGTTPDACRPDCRASPCPPPLHVLPLRARASMSTSGLALFDPVAPEANRFGAAKQRRFFAETYDFGESRVRRDRSQLPVESPPHTTSPGVYRRGEMLVVLGIVAVSFLALVLDVDRGSRHARLRGSSGPLGRAPRQGQIDPPPHH